MKVNETNSENNSQEIEIKNNVWDEGIDEDLTKWFEDVNGKNKNNGNCFTYLLFSTKTVLKMNYFWNNQLVLPKS